MSTLHLAGASPPGVRVVKAVQTCFWCPTAWQARGDGGERLYLHYRYHVGMVHLEPPDADNLLLARFRRLEGEAGLIGLDEFCLLAGLELALDEEVAA